MIASYQHVQHTLDRERLSTFRHYSLGYFVVRFRFPSLGPWGLKSSFSCQWSALYRELVQRISSRFSLHKVMCVYVFSPSWTIRDDESLSTNTWYERLMSFQWWFALHSTPLWNDICSGSMTTMHYSIYLKWNLRYTKVLRYWCHKPFPGLHDIKQILGNVPMALASLNLYSGLYLLWGYVGLYSLFGLMTSALLQSRSIFQGLLRPWLNFFCGDKSALTCESNEVWCCRAEFEEFWNPVLRGFTLLVHVGHFCT